MSPIFPTVTIDQKTNTTSIKAHTLHNFKKMSLPEWHRYLYMYKTKPVCQDKNTYIFFSKQMPICT